MPPLSWLFSNLPHGLNALIIPFNDEIARINPVLFGFREEVGSWGRCAMFVDG